MKLPVDSETERSKPGSLHPDGSLADIERAKDIIGERILSQRPTLTQYLRQMASGECKSSERWKEAYPGCEQAAYRAGSSNAYLDIERKIMAGWFKPENDQDHAQPRRRAPETKGTE